VGARGVGTGTVLIFSPKRLHIRLLFLGDNFVYFNIEIRIWYGFVKNNKVQVIYSQSTDILNVCKTSILDLWHTFDVAIRILYWLLAQSV
jgi:hypothetical protein